MKDFGNIFQSERVLKDYEISDYEDREEDIEEEDSSE